MIKRLILVIAATVSFTEAACTQNNCYRAVQHALQTNTGSADCSSFQKTTVTPPVTTTTITAGSTTVTTTSTSTAITYTFENGPVKLKARDSGLKANIVAPRDFTQFIKRAAPTSVPPYASACSGAAAYKSACSCFGITETVSTAPTPTTTVTKGTPVTTTVVATVTQTLEACSYLNNYGFLYNGGYYESNKDLSYDQAIINQGPYANTGLRKCCQLCFSTLNCISSFHTAENNCFLAIAGTKAGLGDGTAPRNASNVCPLGVAKAFYDGLDGSGDITSPGPCARIVGVNNGIPPVCHLPGTP